MELSLEQTVAEALMERGWHIAFAESCTGGLCAARLVNVPNASRVLDVSFVTYAAQAKIDCLGVRPETIDRFTVVSQEVAREMAAGVARCSGAQVGVGVTGLAGPSGGTPDCPVGTVCFGFSVDGAVTAVTKHFPDLSRNEVRREAVEFVYRTLSALLNK